jgi:hypothetical protein
MQKDHPLTAGKEHQKKLLEQKWNKYLIVNMDQIKRQDIVLLSGIFMSAEYLLHANKKEAIV